MPLVLSVLKTNIKSRDDDNVLLLAIWDIQANKEVSHTEFKELLLKGDLSIPATIVRVRRKIQLRYPELRGDLYYERQKSDRIVRNQIKLNFDTLNNEQ